MADDRGAGWALAGFVMGLMVGAAMALLLTPYTGPEMREKLAEAAKKGKEKGQELLERAKERLFEEGEEAA